MAELVEKPPRLSQILDLNGRDLIVDVHPLEVETPKGASCTISVRVVNGPEAPIDLMITEDCKWLRAKTPRLSLLGGQEGKLDIIVDSGDDGEFANLCFSWDALGEPQTEYVLVWRKIQRQVLPPPTPPVSPPPPPRTSPPTPSPPAATHPAKGVSKKPDWM